MRIYSETCVQLTCNWDFKFFVKVSLHLRASKDNNNVVCGPIWFSHVYNIVDDGVDDVVVGGGFFLLVRFLFVESLF